MSRYIIKFLNDNKNKSFLKNLKKYIRLNYYDRCKVISSFLTHLFISRAGIVNKKEMEENENLIVEVLSILNNIVLCKEDKFLEWFLKKIKKYDSKNNKKR